MINLNKNLVDGLNRGRKKKQQDGQGAPAKIQLHHYLNFPDEEYQGGFDF